MAERRLAAALGWEWCDLCERWVDPDVNPLVQVYDGAGDPDVKVCALCCEDA